MENGATTNRRAKRALRILGTLLVAVLAYPLFALSFGVMDEYAGRRFSTAFALYPIFNLGVGVLVGYRVPRYGWAYAGIPIVVLTAILCVSDYSEAAYLWLPYKLPVGLFGAVLGGFIGERLVRQG